MNKLVEFLVSPFLENKQKNIALIPGGFKPPTAGHFNLIKEVAADASIDEVQVIISPKERNGITVDQASNVYDLYKTYLPSKVKVIVGKENAPVLDCFRIIHNNPEAKFTLVVGIRNEEDAKKDLRRFKTIQEKYGDRVEVKVLEGDDAIRATNARQALVDKDKSKFSQYLPKELSTNDIDYIWDVLTEAYKGKRTNDGAPGTFKAKITKAYGGPVTVAKAKKFKNRPNATAHDKRQANWFINFHSAKNENQIIEDNDPCWDDYEMVGMKMKNGKEVPNCVPKEGMEENVNFNSLERALDEMFDDLDIDINFTKHFKERVIERGLTEEDIIELMEKIHDRYGDEVADMPKDSNRVFSHITRLVDVASTMGTYGHDGLRDLYLKTAYKRKNRNEPEFRTNYTSPKLKVAENKKSFDRLTFYKNFIANVVPQDFLVEVKGNNIVVQNKLQESQSTEQILIPHIAELTKHMASKGLNLEPAPDVQFIEDEENAKELFGRTGYYDPNNQVIVLYCTGRHPKDVLRSFAHEMVHHHQNMEGRLGNVTTTNVNEDSHLEELEREAYETGNILFRSWENSKGKELNETIKKVGDKYVVYPEKGGHRLGTHTTKKAAEKQLTAIHLNEGKYDSLVRQLSKETLEYWIKGWEAGETSITFSTEIQSELDFEVTASLDINEEGIYGVSGGANAQYPPFIQAGFRVPADELPESWSKIAMDLRDFYRHEIEHLTQAGWNEKEGKRRKHQGARREKIDTGELPGSKYPVLRDEIEPMLQGMYLKAKKSRRPFRDVIEDWFDTQDYTPKERIEILKVWRPYLKQLNLPKI